MSTSFIKLLQNYFDSRMDEVHTAIPGRIVEYDASKQEAVVQPMIKRRYFDAEGNPNGLVDQPAIVAVPVVFPSSGGGIISFPVKQGDTVLIIFSEISLDTFNFSDGSAPVDPEDHRKFNYSDAIAIPGLYPFNKTLNAHPNDLVVKFNVGTGSENSFHLKPNGDVVINSPTKVVISADVEVNGNIYCSDTVTATTDVFGGGISLKNHY